MKKVTFLLAIFIIPLISLSQENKFEYTPKVKNRVEIVNLLGEISLKNASGNAIIIESDFNKEKPERAEGLQLLGTLEDNTNLGINLNEENGVVTISGVNKHVQDFKFTISIPQGIAVSIDYHNPFASSDIKIDSYKGSLEIKTLSANVQLTECTGPFTVNSISGDVEVIFNSINQDEPSSFASVSGLVDVTVPASGKASFEINSLTGNVYNNLDLQSEKQENKDERAMGLSAIKHKSRNNYTMNGGGQKILLKSVSGNIYLRKK